VNIHKSFNIDKIFIIYNQFAYEKIFKFMNIVFRMVFQGFKKNHNPPREILQKETLTARRGQKQALWIRLALFRGISVALDRLLIVRSFEVHARPAAFHSQQGSCLYR